MDMAGKILSLAFAHAALLLVVGGADAGEMVLQQGVGGYKGCDARTLWDGGAKKPAEVSDKFLYVRGTGSRLHLKFDMSGASKHGRLARARLLLFVPSATVRTICEIRASESLDSSGSAFDQGSDFKNGRPPGVMDSNSIWEYDGKYFSHKYSHMLVPEGGKWLEFNISPAAEKWLADPSKNHGVIVHAVNLPDKRFPHNASMDIPSHLNPQQDKRPKLVLDFEPCPDFFAGMTHTLSRFTDMDDRFKFQGPFNESHEIFMAKNEYAGFQVMIYPMKSGLKNLRFEISDLKHSSDGKSIIPASDIGYNCIEIFKLFENQKVKDWYFHGYNPWTPDPLVWDKPMDCPRQISTPFWFTVKTSPRTIPGIYEGTVTAKADNAQEKKLKLKVKVWNYSIPEKWNFETMGQTCWGNIKSYYGNLSPELKRKYIDFLLDHRFSPLEQYVDKLSPDIEDMQHCLSRGMSTIYLSGTYKGDISRLKEAYDKVKSLGDEALSKAIIYIGDETDNWTKMRELASEVRKQCPDAMIMIGGSYPRPELEGVIDIYDPQIDHNQKKGHTYAINSAEVAPLVKKSKAAGEKFFWYVAAGPSLPCPNVQMEDPLIASRVLFWITRKFGVEGFEYYCYNIWKDGNLSGKWPEVPHSPNSFGRNVIYNGDGNLFYPGPEGPFSSVRFENIRDGIEDWESLQVLDDCIAVMEVKMKSNKALANAENMALLSVAKKISAVPEEITGMDFTSWTWEPEVLIKAHRDMGETIDRMRKFVGDKELEDEAKRRIDEKNSRHRKMLQKRAATSK